MKFDLIPAAGARVLICSINARNRSPSPNLRIARSTRPLACWNDRSK